MNRRDCRYAVRLLLLGTSLSLFAADGATYAQSGSRPESATTSAVAATPQASAAQAKTKPWQPSVQQRSGADHFADCMKKWDKRTHMTKQEWSRTCRRLGPYGL
jgi:hypothetical protein